MRKNRWPRQIKIVNSLLRLIIFVFGAFLMFIVFYPKETIMMYGSKEFEGAYVYADNRLVGVMTWDEKEKRTYAKDINLVNGNIFNRSKFWIRSPQQELFKLPTHTLEVDFKVITKDNKIYMYKAYNGEDVAYNAYLLQDFSLVTK